MLRDKQANGFILTASYCVEMSEKALCDRDLSILDLIFDKTAVKRDDVKEIVQPVNDEVEVKDEDEGNSEEIVKSKALELEGVALTEAGKLQEALEKFNESIQIAQQRPSPYNNRAQLYRFMEKDECEVYTFVVSQCAINFYIST